MVTHCTEQRCHIACTIEVALAAKWWQEFTGNGSAKFAQCKAKMEATNMHLAALNYMFYAERMMLSVCVA
eukprot:800917-Pelagomonas_calceolata.AAC.5